MFMAFSRAFSLFLLCQSIFLLLLITSHQYIYNSINFYRIGATGSRSCLGTCAKLNFAPLPQKTSVGAREKKIKTTVTTAEIMTARDMFMFRGGVEKYKSGGDAWGIGGFSREHNGRVVAISSHVESEIRRHAVVMTAQQ